MTTEPSKSDISTPKSKDAEFFRNKSLAAIEDLFRVGYTESGDIVVFRDESKEIEITARFRTLTPTEIRDVEEIVSKYESAGAKGVMQGVETLARAIIHINGRPLILPTNEVEELKKQIGREPDRLDQAREILHNKVRSWYVLDAMFDAYQEFTAELDGYFEGLKKKLKSQQPSSSTGQS
ncbi:MAG: hypothetical protein WC444_05120 [Candidatus Paceibacterota bacterium]